DIGDHEVAERCKFTVAFQLDAAAREPERLSEIASIEAELGEKKEPLGERGIALDRRAVGGVLFNRVAQFFEDFAEIEFSHVASRMEIDLLSVLGNRRSKVAALFRRRR